MKMMCPHCGVKGSAQGSPMGKRVRCPKCRSIFDVSPDVLQPLPVEESELEQIYSSASAEAAVSTEEEVDDIFSKLLGEESDSSAGDEKEVRSEEVREDEIVAAFAHGEDEEPTLVQSEKLEADDETLTVVEEDDTAEPPAASAIEEEKLFPDDDEDLIEAAATEDNEEYAQQTGTDDEAPGILDFTEELKDSEDDVSLELDEGGAEQEVSPSDAADEAMADAVAAADEEDEVDEVELEEGEEAVIVQKCSACGEYVDPENKHEYDGNVYCSRCVPTELKRTVDDEEIAAAARSAAAAVEVEAVPGRFTIGTLLKDAWHYSKGAKGSIWAALILMYLILIGMGAASVLYLVPMLPIRENPLQLLLVEGGLQLLYTFLCFVFTAGILLIAINKIGQLPYSWKMVFSGFKRIGSLLLLFILQSVMLLIGFLLFILPGIYLSIGYILAIPLLFVKKLSPWQALEVSRQAVHKRWWTVFFTLVVMGILLTVSSIPLGLGLIWTVPMFFILVGVLYYHFFGADDV